MNFKLKTKKNSLKLNQELKTLTSIPHLIEFKHFILIHLKIVIFLVKYSPQNQNILVTAKPLKITSSVREVL